MTSKSANRYSPEFRERAVRMLLDQRGEYRSEHAAIHSLAPKVGCSTDTLRTWLRQHERMLAVVMGASPPLNASA